MKNASRHALSFLIISFILCFIFLFVALYIYHDRNLSQEKPPQGETFRFQRDKQSAQTGETAQPKNRFVQRMRSTYTKHWIDPEDRDMIIAKSGLAARFALIHTLQLLPTLVLFLFVTAFSIFFTLSPFQSESFQYHHVAIPSYFTLLAFVFLIILAELFFIPNLFKDSETLVYRSRVAHAALAEARELRQKGELQKAREVIEIYLTIDEKNADARSLHDQILEGLYEQGFSQRQKAEEKEGPVEDEFLFEKGQEAMSRGDFYAALYYFQQALKFRGDDREIRKYIDRAQYEVNQQLGSLSQQDKAVKYYIEKKKDVIDLIETGDFYGAYDILSSLRKNRELAMHHPELIRDVELYYNDVKKRLAQYDFLPEESNSYAWLPAFDHIMFTDGKGFINTVERIASWNGQFYLYGINRYSIKDPRVRRSFLYGKWIGNRYRLKGLEGSREFSRDSTNYMRVPEARDELYFIETGLHPGYLLYFNASERLLRQLTVYERFSLYPALRASGFDIEGRFVYLSRKLGSFFGVYILALILAGIAWSKRSIYEFPPRFKLLLYIIIAPVLCYLFHHLYMDANSMFIYSHRYAARFFLKNINIALYTGIINTVIALFATIFYLSQRSSVE